MVVFTNQNVRVKKDDAERPIVHDHGRHWEKASDILRAGDGPDKYHVFDQFADKAARDGWPTGPPSRFHWLLRKGGETDPSRSTTRWLVTCLPAERASNADVLSGGLVNDAFLRNRHLSVVN